MNLTELKSKPVSELIDMATSHGRVLRSVRNAVRNLTPARVRKAAKLLIYGGA